LTPIKRKRGQLKKGPKKRRRRTTPTNPNIRSKKKREGERKRRFASTLKSAKKEKGKKTN